MHYHLVCKYKQQTRIIMINCVWQSMKRLFYVCKRHVFVVNCSNLSIAKNDDINGLI